MLSDAASSTGATYDPGPLRAGWKDEFWVALVGTFDAWLRSYYGIQELTDDPQCVLRIGPMPARMPVLLADGTEIREGEPVGALHLWNEHVPRYTGNGPTLAWARRCGGACCARLPSWQILSSMTRFGPRSGRFAATRPCPAASAARRCAGWRGVTASSRSSRRSPHPAICIRSPTR